MLKSLSRVLGITGSGISLFAFLYLIVRYISVLDFSDLESFCIDILISAAGLIGSLLIPKKPRLAAVIMIASGILVFYFLSAALFEAAPVWIAFISAFLLTAAGVLALVANKASADPPLNEGPRPAVKSDGEVQPVLAPQKVSRLFGDPVLKKLSFISGLIGILLAVLPFIMLASIDTCSYLEDEELLVSIVLFIAPVLTLTVTALAFSAIVVLRFFIRKRPLIAGVIMIVFSGLNLLAPFPWGYFLTPPSFFDTARIISALLLIAAAVFALISRGKAASCEGLPNKTPGIPG